MSRGQGEQMFGLMPLCFATYPAIALRLPHFDEKRLKQSLCHGFCQNWGGPVWTNYELGKVLTL